MSVLGSLLYKEWPHIDIYGVETNYKTGIHLATTAGWELHLSIEQGIDTDDCYYSEINLTVEQAKLVVEKMQAFILMREIQGRA